MAAIGVLQSLSERGGTTVGSAGPRAVTAIAAGNRQTLALATPRAPTITEPPASQTAMSQLGVNNWMDRRVFITSCDWSKARVR